MVLSQTAVYALKATLHLAEHDMSDLQRVDDISEELGVPRNYLSKILHTLAREGVLASTRGPGGGFQLARPATELTLEEIVRRFDGLPSESSCLLGRPECSDEDPCAAHARWVDVSHAVRRFFRDTTVADLARTGNPTNANAAG
jgi:Rrf2 family protein